MTDAALTAAGGRVPNDAAAAATASAPAGDPPPASFGERAVRLTLRATGARIGLAWIGLMGVLAAFAPFLANSHPILLKQAGQWSSPLLRHLTAIDVVLQVVFWTAVGLWLAGRRLPFRRKAAVLLGVTAAATLLAAMLVRPPLAVVYDVYRTAATAGRVEAAVHAPIRFSPADRLRDQEDVRFHPPDRRHWMGTTADSADLAANMIYAARIALSIGFVATGVAVALGILMGATMGYVGGWADLAGMRVVEVFQSIPSLLLLLAFVALFQETGPAGLYIMMAIIGFTQSFGYAEFVRAEFLALRNREFVHAARAAGVPVRSILFRHMLPNALTPVIVSASFGVATAILTESTLSFLGLGLKEEASWGNLLNQALGSGGTFYWWMALYPGLAIFLTVFSYNLIGEALRDALDPALVRTG